MREYRRQIDQSRVDATAAASIDAYSIVYTAVCTLSQTIMKAFSTTSQETVTSVEYRNRWGIRLRLNVPLCQTRWRTARDPAALRSPFLSRGDPFLAPGDDEDRPCRGRSARA